MPNADSDRLAGELETLLEGEADALRAARFAELDAIAQRKESLVARGAIDALGPQAVERLRVLSQRNAALLDGARGGLKAAMARIEAGRAPVPDLNTYDLNGRRRAIPSQADQRSHRA